MIIGARNSNTINPIVPIRVETGNNGKPSRRRPLLRDLRLSCQHNAQRKEAESGNCRQPRQQWQQEPDPQKKVKQPPQAAEWFANTRELRLAPEESCQVIVVYGSL